MGTRNISEATTSRSDRATTAVFLLMVVVGGSNSVAVRFSNRELAPFWGAAARLAIAALIFWAIILVRRIPLPGGRALHGALLYGILSIGGFFAFIYWALLSVQAGLSMVMLALTPLFTFFFAWAHGLEPFRWRGLFGVSIAFIGILIGVGAEIGKTIPLASLLALVAAAACAAEGAVVFKIIPKSHPLATNALALTVGAATLLTLSIIFREPWGLPSTAVTWLALAYLVLIGSVGLFSLVLYVLGRWTASATSYSFLLFPVATIIIAAWLAHERVTPLFLFGGILVLCGVWVGAFAQPRRSAVKTQG